jgi:hypothetical protein
MLKFNCCVFILRMRLQQYYSTILTRIKNMFKKVLFALFIATSGLAMTSVATTAVAAETAAGVKKGLADTIAHIKAGIEAIKENQVEAYKEHIKEARQTSKEINSGSGWGAKLQVADSALAQAVKAAKADDMHGAQVALEEALAVYSKLQ